MGCFPLLLESMALGTRAFPSLLGFQLGLVTEAGTRLNFMCWAKVQVLPVAKGPWRPRWWGEWAAQLFTGPWLFPFTEQCINLSVFALTARAVDMLHSQLCSGRSKGTPVSGERDRQLLSLVVIYVTVAIFP